MIAELWKATLNVITECPCEDGCPSCVQSPKCGNNNKPLDKAAAKIILEEMRGSYNSDNGKM
jgi:DEAD/DEAH box helicase domain-containing protein